VKKKGKPRKVRRPNIKKKDGVVCKGGRMQKGGEEPTERRTGKEIPEKQRDRAAGWKLLGGRQNLTGRD